MAQVIQGHTVVRVSPRTSRDGSKQMWDVGLSDGNEWTTFDGATASLAASIVNQQGYAFEVSLNGKYKNLESIIAPGQAMPQQAVAPGTTIAAGTPVMGNGTGPTSVVGNPDSAKDEKIRRQVAFKGAVELVSALFAGAGPEGADQAVELVASITQRFDSGIKALDAGALTQAEPVLQHDGTPEGVAQAVNEAATAGAAVQTGSRVAW